MLVSPLAKKQRVRCIGSVRVFRPYTTLALNRDAVSGPIVVLNWSGLGVATVFYPGYLRAALLAQVWVVGVFQSVQACSATSTASDSCPWRRSGYLRLTNRGGKRHAGLLSSGNACS